MMGFLNEVDYSYNLHAPTARRNNQVRSQNGILKGLRPLSGVQRQRLWRVQGRALVAEGEISRYRLIFPMTTG